MKIEEPMKIAVSASVADLDTPVDPRFGRAACFLIVDPETMQFEAVKNPNVSAAGGAGIQSAQLIADKGAQVVLTGNVGPNAVQTLQAANVRIITGTSGKIRDAIEQYKQGKLQPTDEATVSTNFGRAGGRGGMGRN